MQKTRVLRKCGDSKTSDRILSVVRALRSLRRVKSDKDLLGSDAIGDAR